MKRLHSLLLRIMQPDRFLAFCVMGMRGTSLVVKFIFTLFVARFMGFDVLGSYGLVASSSIIASLFFGLTLIHTISRNAVTQTREEICQNLRYYGLYIVSIYSILFLSSFVLGHFFSQTLLFNLILCVILLEHINGDFYRLFLNLSQPFIANLLHFFRTATWMIIYMLLASFIEGIQTLNWLMTFWILGNLISIVCTLYMMRDWPWTGLKLNTRLFKWVKTEFSFARNQHVTSVLTSLSQYWGHFLISIFLGLELTGVYVFFMQVQSALMNLACTGVLQIARPKLVRAFKNKTNEYMNIFFKCLRDTSLVTSLMALAAWPMIYITIQYLNKPLAIEWFPIFSYVLVLFMTKMVYETLNLIFYSQYRDDLVLKISIVFIILSLALNTLAVMLFSLWGAVLSQIVVMVIIIIMQICGIRKLIKENQENVIKNA